MFIEKFIVFVLNLKGGQVQTLALPAFLLSPSSMITA